MPRRAARCLSPLKSVFHRTELTELSAPAGYMIANPIMFMLDAHGNVVLLNVSESNGRYTVTGRTSTDAVRITMYDKLQGRDYELPSTGGRGTMMYTMIGVLLLLISGAGYLMYKKLIRGKEVTPME